MIFVDATEIGEDEDLQTGKDRRQRRRRKTDLKTTVTLKGLTLACRLVNLSTTGALIAASFHPPIGARVELDLPGRGPATAAIARVTSAYIALTFEEPIELDAADGNDRDTAPMQAASAAV